jgi:nucleoside-diphosphate-sugar epimerase
MNTLIIGHRGFVGGNLANLLPGATGVGRADIGSIAGNSFADIYCAAPQAKKWWANQNPDQDRQEVDDLIAGCRRISCRNKFILFSTVDVYDPPSGNTELDLPQAEAHPYGANRFYLEKCITEHFGSKAKVIRLPALVGQGLKKNVIYDLIYDNNVEQINANSAFQWFNLAFLGDILKMTDQLENSRLINVASEPLPTVDLVRACFPHHLDRLNWQATPIGYDMRTVLGVGGNPYLYSKDEVLEYHLKPFIAEQGPK